MFSILFSSCTYIYYPSKPVVPVSSSDEEKLGVEAAVSFTRAQLSGWYFFNKNLYAIGYLAGAISPEDDGDTIARLHYHAVSGVTGVGIKMKFSDQVQLHLQAGTGICQGYFRTSLFNDPSNEKPLAHYNPIVNVNTKSIRYYIQPFVGFTKKNGHNGLYLVPRFTYESFKKVQCNPSLAYNPAYNNVRPVLLNNFWIVEAYGSGFIDIKNNYQINFTFGFSSHQLEFDPFLKNKNAFVAQPFLICIGFLKTFN